MNDFSKFVLKAFLRKALTALGAVLLTHGVLTDSEAGGLVDGYLEEVAGAVLIGGSSVWTWAYQRYVKVKVVTALEMPPGTSSEKLERAVEAKQEKA